VHQCYALPAANIKYLTCSYNLVVTPLSVMNGPAFYFTLVSEDLSFHCIKHNAVLVQARAVTEPSNFLRSYNRCMAQFNQG